MATDQDALFEAARQLYIQQVNDRYAAIDAKLDEQEAMQ